MKILLLAASAAMALTAVAEARPAKRSAPVAGPPQPIPYSQLDAYLKASPRQRASRNWSSAAAMGAATNASAIVAGRGASTSSDTTQGAAGSTVSPPVSPGVAPNSSDTGAGPSAAGSTSGDTQNSVGNGAPDMTPMAPQGSGASTTGSSGSSPK